MLYHYGRNWMVPGDGEYRLQVHIEPPRFMRHDEINGHRFTEAVDVEFDGVRVKTGSRRACAGGRAAATSSTPAPQAVLLRRDRPTTA